MRKALLQARSRHDPRCRRHRKLRRRRRLLLRCGALYPLPLRQLRRDADHQRLGDEICEPQCERLQLLCCVRGRHPRVAGREPQPVHDARGLVPLLLPLLAGRSANDLVVAAKAIVERRAVGSLVEEGSSLSLQARRTGRSGVRSCVPSEEACTCWGVSDISCILQVLEGTDCQIDCEKCASVD